MNLFSQRIGKTPIKSVIQTDSIDEDLKNALWNGLTIFYWDGKVQDNWIENNPNDVVVLYSQTNEGFVEYCNNVLERELSAYRFVNGILTQISSKDEVEAIEEALNITDNLKPVKTHLNRALELFSDRKTPDYRNSIKESISAIESYYSILTGSPKATLGQALKQIEKDNNIHPALKNSISSLYGYTSDADGIRHALLEDENLNQEDAKFMLVACSAFINYLRQKEAKTTK